jgi:hypothetical protein
VAHKTPTLAHTSRVKTIKIRHEILSKRLDFRGVFYALDDQLAMWSMSTPTKQNPYKTTT